MSLKADATALANKQDKLPDGTADQVLTWSGGAWTAADATGGGGGGGTADGVALIYFDAPIPDGGAADTGAWQDIPQGGKLIVDGHPIAFGFEGITITGTNSTPTLAQIKAGAFYILASNGNIRLDVREKPGVAGQLQWDWFRTDLPGATNPAVKLLSMRFPISAAGELVVPGVWRNLDKSAASATGEVGLSAEEIAGVSELAATYGTAANINGGTDSHSTTGNNDKVFATNIPLAIIPPYAANNAWVQFGGFGRGAQQYIVQAKRTADGGLTLEAVDNNSNSNQAIYSVWAR